MISLELRKGYSEDVQLDEIWKGGGVHLLICVVVMAILFVISLFITTGEYRAEANYNVQAEEFNALSLIERQCLHQYGGGPYDKADPDTLLLELKPALPLREQFKMTPTLVWVILLVLVFICTAWGMVKKYREYKERCYFYADFPLRSPLYVLTYIVMFVGVFPLFLVSSLRLFYHHLRQDRAEHREVQRLAVLENLGSESRQILPPRVAQCSAVDIKRYCEMRVSRAETYQQEAIEQAQAKVEAGQARLAELGQSLQRVQRSLNTAKAELKEVESAAANLQTPAAARNELDVIREMRGVSKVSVPKSAGKDKPTLLRFVVKVRVPYQGELYDFGDYEISFRPRDFKCKHLRSGVRLNATSHSPDYSTSDGFCFGDRDSVIRDYVKAGRYAEAATLVVDSLHSVNNKDVEEDIPKCFRKVRIVERKAKWLKFAEKKG